MSERYADKELLKKLNDRATALNYNRTLYPEAIDKLPDDEIFAVTPIMVHEHAQGKAVDPHLRCFIKSITGQTDMNFVMIDVPMKLFEALPKKEDLTDGCLTRRISGIAAGTHNHTGGRGDVRFIRWLSGRCWRVPSPAQHSPAYRAHAQGALG